MKTFSSVYKTILTFHDPKVTFNGTGRCRLKTKIITYDSYLGNYITISIYLLKLNPSKALPIFLKYFHNKFLI